MGLFQLTLEPRFGQSQVSLNCGAGNSKRVRDLFIAQSSEVMQLNDFSFSRIEGRELCQRMIERYHGL